MKIRCGQNLLAQAREIEDDARKAGYTFRPLVIYDWPVEGARLTTDEVEKALLEVTNDE